MTSSQRPPKPMDEPSCRQADAEAREEAEAGAGERQGGHVRRLADAEARGKAEAGVGGQGGFVRRPADAEAREEAGAGVGEQGGHVRRLADAEAREEAEAGAGERQGGEVRCPADHSWCVWEGRRVERRRGCGATHLTPGPRTLKSFSLSPLFSASGHLPWSDAPNILAWALTPGPAGSSGWGRRWSSSRARLRFRSLCRTSPH